ncbi:MAG: DUF6089 family protein [Bacteroidota bacterium]
MKTRFTLLTLVLLATAFGANAQLGKRAKNASMRAASRKVANFTNTRDFPSTFKYSTIGFGIGYANYFGDLTPNTSRTSTNFNRATPTFNAFYMKRLSAFLSVRVNAAYSIISADDNAVDPTLSISHQARYLRNLSFRNQIKEIGIMLQGDILPTNRGYMRRNFLNPYGFFGVNVFTNNPQAKGPENTQWAGTWIDLQAQKTEGQGMLGGAQPYSTVQIGIPIGFGLRYRLGNNFDLSLEFGYRLTFTNYLDDIGRNFYNFDADKGGVAGTELQVLMANRSAEVKGAYSGDTRYLPVYNGSEFVQMSFADVFAGGSPLALAARESMIATTYAANGKPTFHIVGYNNGASPRGGGGRDYYLLTGFHLGYIMHDKSRAPRFR